jgi:O-antigen/teichoic acid export membrane protein
MFDVRKAIRWLSILQVSEIVIQSITKIFLAWILTPSAFGVVGSALILIGLMQATSQTGIYAALVQKDENVQDYLDTGWSLEVLRGLTLYAAIYYAAPLYVEYMMNSEQSEYINVIRVLSLTIIIDAAKNIGIVLFDKHANFKQIFNFQISGLIVKTTSTLLLSLYLNNYWGMVFGMILGSLMMFIMSYVLSDYRPKFKITFKKSKHLLNFGIWVFFYTLTGYLVLKMGDLFVLKYIGIEELGIFQMAFFIGMLLRNSISEIQNRILFPLVARYQKKPKMVGKLYIRSLEVSALLYLPSGVGLALISQNLVSIFFDKSWAAMSSILPLIVVAGIFSAFIRSIEQIYKGVGLPKYIFWFSLISALMLFYCAYFLYERTLLGVTYAILTSSLIHLGLIIIHSFNLFRLHSNLSLTNFYLIFFSVIPMSIFVVLMNQIAYFQNTVQLLLSIFVGAIVYIFTIYRISLIFNILFIKRMFNISLSSLR